VSAARQLGSVRTTEAVGSLFDEQVIPAGTRGTVLEARPDGTCLAVVAFALQELARKLHSEIQVREAG
jgi:hypothetical protein